MSDLRFPKLTMPDQSVLDAFNRWGKDPDLAPLVHPNQTEGDVTETASITAESLAARLEHRVCYLILLDGELIGEMTYQVDPVHLSRQVPGTAWLSITIGEPAFRGRGIGLQAMQHLEAEIMQAGLKRMELGVFEFNTPAIKLYLRMGFLEIARIKDFTYWQGRWWDDIRMEKSLSAS